MKNYQPVELIISPSNVFAKSKPSGSIKKLLQDSGIPVAEVNQSKTKMPASKKPMPKSALSHQKTYIKTKMTGAEMNPWDVAHTAAKALGPQAGFVEPDLLNEYAADQNIDVPYKKSPKNKIKKNNSVGGFDPDWQPHKNIFWHLEDAFSQLASARKEVEDIDYTIRIAHIDTGYSPTHVIIPESAKKNKLQRNFVGDEDPADAHDRNTKGTLRMPGHSTGTLGILAGNKMRINTDNGIFNDFIGAAPFAEIVSCRIASSVVLIKTSAFAEALNYLTSLCLRGYPIHVVSMSMGGAPSKAWADAVNAAYEAGITIVTAAGNHFNGLPTKHIIYPARFKRVIAACGVTYDLKPYAHSKLGEMQGCWGPERHMEKALAAFTPNTPWATGNNNRISFAGAGTSSATPQVAAAAAIYYRKYHKELDSLQPWQRVEAIRYALYKTAGKNGQAPGSFKAYFGNGIIKAKAALNIPVNDKLPKTSPDRVPLFPILTTIFKNKPGASAQSRLDMYNTELAQLLYDSPELQKIIDNEDKPFEKISKKKWKLFKESVIEHPEASISLKQYLMATP